MLAFMPQSTTRRQSFVGRLVAMGSVMDTSSTKCLARNAVASASVPWEVVSIIGTEFHQAPEQRAALRRTFVNLLVSIPHTPGTF